MSSILLAETTELDYDEYYRIRCSPTDIYWNGYTQKPDYILFKNIYMKRTSNSRFSEPEDRRIYLIRNENRINVGFIQLIMRKEAVEIGYSITEEYQHRGYATQALLKAIPLAKEYAQLVIVRVRDDNFASQRVAIKCGFCRTARYEEKVYPTVGTVKLRTYEYNGH